MTEARAVHNNCNFLDFISFLYTHSVTPVDLSNMGEISGGAKFYSPPEDSVVLVYVYDGSFSSGMHCINSYTIRFLVSGHLFRQQKCT